VLRALVSVKAEPELFDAPQALKLNRVNQAHHQLTLAIVGAKANDVVNWIAIDSFRHFGGLLIPAN
jgi:hypothetical protein